jgi:hypothetical protein
MFRLLLVVLVVLLLTAGPNGIAGNGGVSMAYPTGSGSCIGGKAAVGGSHLEPSNGVLLSGSLTEGSVVVTLDQQTLQSSSSTATVQSNQEYTLSVTSNNPNGGFRGILIRMELTTTGTTATAAASESDSFVTTDMTQLSFLQWDTSLTQLTDDICSSEGYNLNVVQGLTHVNNDEKKQITATVRFDTPGTVHIDITIVGANRDSIGSVYGYERFPIQVVASTSEPPNLNSNNGNLDITGTLSPTYTPPGVIPPTTTVSSSIATHWHVGLFSMSFILLHWIW